MSSFGNIVKKEMKELLTPATIIPIIIIALLFGTLGSSIEGIQEEFSEDPVIGYINEDSGMFSSIFTSYLANNSKVVFNSTTIDDKEDGLQLLKEKEGVALLVIHHNFTENILNNSRGHIEVYWIMKGAGILDTISSEVVEDLIYFINQKISTSLVERNTTVNATIALNPTSRIDTTYFKDRVVDLSPAAITGFLDSQSAFIPIIIMMLGLMQ
jgi:ABC-2 type transport system permease protein